MDLKSIEEDIKAKPYLLLVPVGVLGYVFIKGRTGTTNNNSAPGSLNQMPATTGVSTDMLANAIQDITNQQNQNLQDLNTEITGIEQQQAQAAATTQQAISQSTQSFNEKISQLQQSVATQIQQSLAGMNMGNSGSNSGGVNNHPAAGNSQYINARNRIGDNNIISYFNQFKLPSWIGLQYVAENYSLPSSISQLESWLNVKGYRDPNTGKFTSAVSVGEIPANVRQEIDV